MQTNKHIIMNRSLGDRLLDGFLYILFTVMMLLCIYPFYYLIINTVSANNISAAGDVIFWPKDFHVQNYIQVFKIPGLGRAAIISVLRTVLGTIGTVLASAFLGFKFTQEKMSARTF